MADNQKPLEITPISAWVEDYETVQLPSGKVVGLRQVDVLNILTADGRVPNMLLPVVQGHMDGVNVNENGEMVVDVDELPRLNQLLNRLTRSSFVKPAIVDTREQVERGEGILCEMVSYADKIALITYSMGGKAAIDASKKFLEQQYTGVDVVQPGKNVPQDTE